MIGRMNAKAEVAASTISSRSTLSINVAAYSKGANHFSMPDAALFQSPCAIESMPA